ncbi:MAG: M14 family zinc carboxypeptidase [Gammaproteobacteria bacterium]
MRLLAVITTLILSLAVGAAGPEPEKWFTKERETAVVRAYFDSQNALQELANRTHLWTVNREHGFAVVEVDSYEHVELTKLGLRIELDTVRTDQLYMSRVRSPNQRNGITGFECYRTVDETFATAEQLALDHPTLAEWIDIGDTWEKINGSGGNDMQVLKITNQNITGDKPKLFAMSAVHARELTTAELNTRFAEYLLQNYATNADARWLVDHHEIHLSLQSNPDGRRQAEELFPWRKNTNEDYCGATSNQRGADLNRNFEFNWGCCGGSSTQECSGIFRGASAASEPEVDAIQSYVRSIFEDQRGEGIDDPAPLDAQGVFLDIHSFSQLILYPWGFINQPAPNATELTTMARKLAFFNDYTAIPITGLTIADGSTADFAYGELGVAAYAFELGTNFFESCGDFEQTVLPDNLKALIYAAKTARAPYLLPAGPDVTDLRFDNNTILTGMSVQLLANVSDTRTNTNTGSEPVHNISGANAYIDTPPWMAGAVALPLEASDGAFDDTSEAISTSLDLSNLAAGEHTVYVEATDVDGSTGVVSAAFVYVLDAADAATISGFVTAADTGSGLNAIVTAGTSQTITSASGAYSLLTVGGNFSVTATTFTDDYEAETEENVTASAGSTTNVDLILFPFCAIFEDDVETDSVAWTATGDWARTDASSNSPTFSWTDSPAGNYGNNQNVTLTSPAFDLSDSTTATLSFAQRCNTEPFADSCIIEISGDGVTWTEVERYDAFSANPSNFTQITLDVSALAGAATAQIRFRLQTDANNVGDGWYVDDVRVETSGTACLTSADTDLDGVQDSVDNCTLVSNPSQLDTDTDGFGNACDADFNNDGITNFLDLARFADDFLATGTLVTDTNGDGVVNFVDLITVRDFFLMPPGPGGQSFAP